MKRFLKRKFVILITLFMIGGLVPAGVFAAATSGPGVSYQTQIENIGWETDAGIGLRSNGEASGTSGQSLRLEGIKIDLDKQGYDLGVSYQTHIQNIGWEADTKIGWKSNGETSGTEGQALRLEAIQIKLSGADADQFDIYYQVHAQNVGWMGWAKNGESAGTAGYGYRLEAIKIVIVPKGQGAPSAIAIPAFMDKKSSTIEGNLFIRSTAADFNVADTSFDNVEVSNNGDGAIVLKSGTQSGVYTSNTLSTSPFNKLVLSWNSDTPAGTSIQVQARVALTANGQWSNWLTWGTWGTSLKSGSGTGLTDDPVAKVDVDTLVVKNGQTAAKIQYRVILNSDRPGVTPTVRLVSGALRNTGQGINKVFPDNPDLSNLSVLDVPKLSQMIRDPAIADSICSPTSVAMVLNYYGTQLTPEQVAWGVYDNNYEDFGNWPFNTAFAGSLGYRAYVDYSTIDGLKREIANGHPAIAAVAYKNSANVSGNLPVLDGAPIASTNGHLIVVCGFTNENGMDYIIINDPAAGNNAGVRVRYRLDQFQNAWAESGNITYIIHQNEN